MKIYSRIKLNIDTWEVLEENSYEYDGPMILALSIGGGGGGGDNFDEDYNRRMANIAARQQDMAEEYFDFWRQEQAPTESMRNEMERRLLPQETNLRNLEIRQQMRLMPVEEELTRASAEYTIEDLEARKPLARQYYQEAMKGENEARAAAQAGANVAQEYARARGVQRRAAARAGADVNSGRFAQQGLTTALSRARDIAGQKTSARMAARDRNFARLESAMNKRIGVGV